MRKKSEKEARQVSPPEKKRISSKFPQPSFTTSLGAQMLALQQPEGERKELGERQRTEYKKKGKKKRRKGEKRKEKGTTRKGRVCSAQ